MKVVFVSHTAPGAVFRVGSHHLSREFARMGHDVAHVATPVSPAHLARAVGDHDTRGRLRMARGPRRDADGVLQVVPVAAVPITRAPGPLARWHAARDVARWRRSHGVLADPDVVYVDQPFLVDHAVALRPGTIVYRPTDAHHEHAARAAELRVLDAAAGIAATSGQTLASVVEGTGWTGPTTVVENGVETDHFHAESFHERSGVVYLGALDARFDWATVAHLAQRFPDQRFTVAGPAPRTPPVELPSNVRLVGAVPYQEAPLLLREAAVGLLPFSDDPGNAGRSPMKYYEYLASGLAVVATRTVALAERATPCTFLFSGRDDAVAAMTAALRVGVRDRQDAVDAAALRSWLSRARALADFTATIGAASHHG